MGNMKPFVDCSSVVMVMNKIKNAYETSPVVFERTLKDMRSRAPGKVASAVTSVYGIKKSEIKCKSNSFKRSNTKDFNHLAVDATFWKTFGYYSDKNIVITSNGW